MTRGAELLANAPARLAAGEHARLERELSALCEREPDNARAHFLRGVALHAQGLLQPALDAFERSHALSPDDVHLVNALAGILHSLGRIEEAEQRLARAIEKAPDAADLLVNHALMLEDLGRASEALSDYQRALALQPGNARALQNIAVLLSARGDVDEALRACDTLLDLYPDHVEGQANKGNLLLARRDYPAALAASTRATRLAPGHARAHADRALALAALGDFDAAHDAARRAVTLMPGILRSPEDDDEESPDYPDPRVVYLLTGHHRLARCDWQDFENQCRVFAELAADQNLHSALADQMALLLRSYVLPVKPSLRARLSKNTGQRIANRAAARLWLGGGERRAGEKVRIGYLASQFRVHPGALQLLPMLRGHDRERFEITAFATNADDGSATRARMRAAVDHFVDLHHVDDHEAAWRIHEHGCDLLVFRDGYTELARPGILAQRPAPVQLTWAGYHVTLGGGMADYHISDARSDPPGDAELWDESRLFLPHGPFAFPHGTTPVPRAPSRAALALPQHGLVLAAMHRPEKIDPQLFDAWMRVLTRLPGSVLWLLDDPRGATAALQAHASSRGVDPARLVFAATVDVAEHVHRLAAADVWLDTRWYGSHTTMLDALAAGLPAVTCTGNAVHGRLGMTILNAAGLPQYVTHTVQDYEQAVLRLATDTAERTRVREHLRARRAPLFDVAAFIRTLEDGLLQIWQRHLSGLPPCDTLLSAGLYQHTAG